MSSMIDPCGLETEAFQQLVDFGGKAVLEIGCGDGRLTRRYAAAAASVVALDPVESDIQLALARTPARLLEKVRFQVGDALDMRLPEGAFDIALLARSI
jgi:ubiquinone/menaquinone biosynthesis C-methylase UbiE